MANPYPNANYETAWDEANMLKSGAAPVNTAGTGLTVTDVAAGKGPLLENEGAVTTADATMTSAHDGDPDSTE